MFLVIDSYFNYIKIERAMTSFDFSSSNYPYLKFYLTYKLHTNVQQHKVYLIVRMKVTLTDTAGLIGEGQRSHKMNKINGNIS